MRPIRPFALPECCLLIRGTRQERRQSADQLKPRGTWVRAAAVEIDFGKRISAVEPPLFRQPLTLNFGFRGREANSTRGRPPAIRTGYKSHRAQDRFPR